MLLLAFALNYVAMTALCLAMSRHHKALLKTEPSAARQLLLRSLGLGSLLLALALCWSARGGEIGAVVWLGQLMLSGVLLVSLRAWRERWVLPLVTLLPLAGGISLVL